MAWVAIAGVSAALIGGGIAYGVYRKRKREQQQQLPPAVPTTGGSGTVKKNAPKYPYTEAQARDVEDNWAMAEAHDAFNYDTRQFTKSETQITDGAFYRMYNIPKIPDKEHRGTGWQPYIDSWLRIRDYVRAMMDQLESSGGQ